MPQDPDWFFIKIELRASFTVAIPAETKEEAIREAYNRRIPVESLYDAEKDVVKVVKMTQTKSTVKVEVLEPRRERTSLFCQFQVRKVPTSVYVLVPTRNHGSISLAHTHTWNRI